MARVLLASLLMIVLAITVIGFVKAQEIGFIERDAKTPTRRPVAMANYQEATGTDEHMEAIKRELLKRSEDQGFSMKGKDPAVALRGMADNWAYSNERGQTYSKEKWMAERFDTSDKSLTFPFGQHVDAQWHVFGDSTVVETGRSNSTLVYKGKVSHGPRRETAVFAKVDGRWVQASLHVGFIPAEQKDFTFPAGALPEGFVAGADANPKGPGIENLKLAGYAETAGVDEHIEEIKRQILNRGDQWGGPPLDRRHTMLRAMADNWAYSNERGETFGKEQWVDDSITGNFRGSVFQEHVDVEWHVFGDSTVVETGRSNSTLRYKGRFSHGPRREMAVFGKVDGKWIQLSLHVGMIPSEQEDYTYPAGALPAD
jgi:hypothetical protein